MARLKYLLLAQILLTACLASAGDETASCNLTDKSVVARTSSGLAQVSNMGDIEITCSVPARLERPYMLKVATVASQISADGSKKPVPSEAIPTGSGVGACAPREGDPEKEWIIFYVHLPLEPTERDDEARKYLAKMEKEREKAWPSLLQLTEEDRQRALERLREFVYQHRVGHFQIECRILDGDRLMGVGVIELEVLFKGRFSEVGLFGAPPV